MIPVGKDEILFRFAGIPAVLCIILEITCKKFHPGKLGSRFAGAKFSYVIASARLSGMKKVINTSV